MKKGTNHSISAKKKISDAKKGKKMASKTKKKIRETMLRNFYGRENETY